MNNLLVIIDPQNDFVDPKGSLYVPGAEKAIEEIIKFVKEHGDQIDEIFVTQDSHFKFHIGHSCFWNGDPDPFTTITAKDIKSGKYTPKVDCWIDDALIRCCLSGEDEVIAQIWPEHCINGTWGHALPENLLQTLHEWALNKHISNSLTRTCLVFIPKGQYTCKEEYSAWDALVRVYEEITFFDPNLLPFDGYNKIWISGVAKDVCVANTIKDMCLGELGCSQVSFLDRCMAALDTNAKSLEIFDKAIKKLGAIWEE